MRFQTFVFLVSVAALLSPSAAGGDSHSVMMSADWAAGMCEAWNAEPGLTQNLDGWIENDADRGYKLLRIYRRDCAESPSIQLKTARTGDGVLCVESGWATDEKLTGSDYVMFAETSRWQEMGEGRYGPMRGMMTGRLKFKGPKFEAMRNMGPFSNFLLLVGKVPGSVEACPEMIDDEALTEASQPEVVEEDIPEAATEETGGDGSGG